MPIIPFYFRQPMLSLGYKLLEGEDKLRAGDSPLEPRTGSELWEQPASDQDKLRAGNSPLEPRTGSELGTVP